MIRRWFLILMLGERGVEGSRDGNVLGGHLLRLVLAAGQKLMV
jgi:hypothetical protein